MSPTPNTNPQSAVDLSIILINWRMKDDLAHCLKSIRAHVHRCRSEVILVNKPSGDGTEELVANEYPEVNLITSPIFAISTMRNMGLARARGRHCLILDTDIDILPGCFDSMVRFMDRNPTVGACGGHTTRLNGELEYNVKRFYQLMTIVARRSVIDRIWPDNPWNRWHLMKDKDHEKPFEGDWLAGACFCMRREVIDRIGDFDQSLPYAFEDVEWCWRAKQAGWKIAFNPSARIIHKVQQLSRKGFNRLTIEHLRSGFKFWLKTNKQAPHAPIYERLQSTEQRRDLDLTIVIVNYNAKDLLRDAVSTIAKAAPRHRYEIIVVDNASSDDSVEMIRQEFPDVIVVANRENLGFSKANNQGIAMARGRYVVLLNNDTKSKPRAYSDAIDYLDREPTVGIAGLKLLNRDGSRQLSCRRFPSFRQALFNRHSLLTRLFPRNSYSRDYLMTDLNRSEIRDVDWVSGACLIVRRELIDAIGGLDEEFFMYSEDVDYCFRAWQAGFKVRYLPFAKVIHLIGQSSRRAKLKTTIERHRSMYRFYKKHYSRNLMLIDVLTALTVWVRCGLKLIPSLPQLLEERKGGR